MQLSSHNVKADILIKAQSGVYILHFKSIFFFFFLLFYVFNNCDCVLVCWTKYPIDTDGGLKLTLVSACSCFFL